MDALAAGIVRKKVNWVLDADFRDYFSSLDHRWLERFVEHRIADRRVLRLIRKWFARGSSRTGRGRRARRAFRKGLRFRRCLRTSTCTTSLTCGLPVATRHARGDVVITRFADDFVVGFEHREDAERFWADLRDRLAKFSLELNAEKTRLIQFGRFAAQQRKAAGSRQA